MWLQGNLQAVFDALYTVGAIDPVLKMDWEEVTRKMEEQPEKLHQACANLNDCAGNHEMLVQRLHMMDPESLQFVALEVAREFCEFQDRDETLH